MDEIRKIVREVLSENNNHVDKLKTDYGYIDIAFTDDYGDFNLKKQIPIIMYIQIYKADNINKGYGQELYLKALNKYGVLYSDAPNSNAKNALNSLEIKDLIDTESISFNGNYLTKIEPR